MKAQRVQIDLTAWKPKAGIGAILAIRRAALGPDGVQACFARGILAFCREDYSQAISELSGAIEFSNGMHARSIYYRGIANYRLNRHDEAVADFQKVVEIEPYLADVHGYLYLIYRKGMLRHKLLAEKEKRTYEGLVGEKGALDKPA